MIDAAKYTERTVHLAMDIIGRYTKKRTTGVLLLMNEEPMIVKSHDVHLDSEYTKWIHETKEKYIKTQIKAALKVNSEQLIFN